MPFKCQSQFLSTIFKRNTLYEFPKGNESKEAIIHKNKIDLVLKPMEVLSSFLVHQSTNNDLFFLHVFTQKSDGGDGT